MKRYLAFFGSIYYPRQGMGDFIGDFDTPSDAIRACKERCRKENVPPEYKNDTERWEYHYAHVFDTEKRETVWKK